MTRVPPDNLRKVAIGRLTRFICFASNPHRVVEFVVVYFAIPGLKRVSVRQSRQDWISVRIFGKGPCQVFTIRIRDFVLKFALVCPCLCLFLQGIRPGERRYTVLPSPFIVSV